MILLDTNVLSELLRLPPHPSVETWTAEHAVEDLFFSAIGEAALRFGIALMPAGRRRDGLATLIEAMLREDFEGRVLPFDRNAARAYADIAAARRLAGRPVSPADCQIAAIARSRAMAVATRNVRDFSGTGIEVVNPWEGG